MPLEQGEQEQFNVAITEALGALGHACQQLARAGTHALNLDEPLIVGKVIAHQDALANTSDLLADLIGHLAIVAGEAP